MVYLGLFLSPKRTINYQTGKKFCTTKQTNIELTIQEELSDVALFNIELLKLYLVSGGRFFYVG